MKRGTCKMEKDGKVLKYKIKFKSKGTAYECEVLARNGKIIEYEWEK